MGILHNVGICVKGFDIFSQKKSFSMGADKTIYDFDKCDFDRQSMIIMGKTANWEPRHVLIPLK